jgi:hypothetical protein
MNEVIANMLIKELPTFSDDTHESFTVVLIDIPPNIILAD